MSALLQAAGAPLVLIFGGCCTNVFTLEAITRQVSKAGTALTFVQFFGVAIGSAIILAFSRQGLWRAVRSPKTPWYMYARLVGFHFAVSLLNNMVLDFHISVPVHIILRSGGSIVTMALAWVLYGKTYSQRQVLAVGVLTLGVVMATFSGGATKRSLAHEDFSLPRFVAGIGIMLLGQVLSSFMGLTLESNFKRYGSTWQESLFWTHALALPCFLPFASTIAREARYFTDMHASSAAGAHHLGLWHNTGAAVLDRIPNLVPFLGLNILTQFLCVVGVNQMAVVSSALSVTVVLNLRKFTSLVLSYGIFGHMLDAGMAIGSVLVFGGALVYAMEGQELASVLDRRRLSEGLLAPQQQQQQMVDHAIPLRSQSAGPGQDKASEQDQQHRAKRHLKDFPKSTSIDLGRHRQLG